jgi:phosphate butyryltransferase
MFKNFSEIGKSVENGNRETLVVAAAAEGELLEALITAKKSYLEKIILVGSQNKILQICSEKNLNPDDFEIIDLPDSKAACELAVQLVHQGRADFIMKGLVDTSIFLKAVINKDYGLAIGGLLSSIMMVKLETYKKFLIITDGGMIIDPDLNKKIGIIRNVVEFSRLIGISPIKIGCLAAKEKVNPKMPATVDAAELKKMSEQDFFGTDVILDGPIAMDLIVSQKAAHIKGFRSEVAGDADVIIVPNIETGNAIIKVMTHLCNAELGGIVMGACVPIVLTSRSDSYENKLNSIILGAFLSQKMGDCHQKREEQQG